MDSKHGKSVEFMKPLVNLFGKGIILYAIPIILRRICSYRFLGRSLLLMPDYESWVKKIMDPAFSKQYMSACDPMKYCLCVTLIKCRFLQGLVPKFNSIVDCHLKKLQPLANGKTSTPLAFYIQQFVLSIVSEVRQCKGFFVPTNSMYLYTSAHSVSSAPASVQCVQMLLGTLQSLPGLPPAASGSH